MYKQLISIALALVLSACSPTSTAVPGLPSPPSNNPVVVSATTSPQTIPSAVLAQPAQTTIPVTETVGTLQLQVLAPEDEAVVSVSQVEVYGLAAPDTVVTVNDEILIVGADGQFKVTLALDEGPNLIEIVASDVNGNEATVLLTVTHEP